MRFPPDFSIRFPPRSSVEAPRIGPPNGGSQFLAIVQFASFAFPKRLERIFAFFLWVVYNGDATNPFDGVTFFNSRLGQFYESYSYGVGCTGAAI